MEKRLNAGGKRRCQTNLIYFTINAISFKLNEEKFIWFNTRLKKPINLWGAESSKIFKTMENLCTQKRRKKINRKSFHFHSNHNHPPSKSFRWSFTFSGVEMEGKRKSGGKHEQQTSLFIEGKFIIDVKYLWFDFNFNSI